MNHRSILSAGGVTAGLLTAAFLPAAAAVADPGIGAAGDTGATALPVGLTAGTGTPAPLGDTGALPAGPTATGADPLGDTGSLTPAAVSPTAVTPDSTPDATSTGTDGFTLGQDTFNPVQADGTPGFTPLSPLFSAPPFFQAGDGDQTFDLTGGSGGTDLGSVTTSEDVTNLFGGIHNTEFTITGVNPAAGETASDLPAMGSVYDVANFGNGYENVYTDIPGADGSANSITDTLVTPFGDVNIPTSFDAAALLDPGAAFSGVDLSSLGTGAADGAVNAVTSATTGATDAATGATDAVTGATDAATGAADAASTIDPLSFLGL
ncbi:hypothetical protein KIH27_21055 [Mycobacterium sp. M1]|uniref:Uncharacterized protein n=1 Tax=Mycolicibacter acidiphilus TaxID=2835306 RepID=A0ABS5RP54_9MYCO|nr:hypothetical protein [Mycolicibacter acidiphilus]MBS9536075.1 hypothetical protein [Mycolicibacter acidiphilus]